MADYNSAYTGAQLDSAIEKVLGDYADVSGVTAAAGDVRSGKYFISAAKVLTAGTADMTINGSAYVCGSFTTESTLYTITINHNSGVIPRLIIVWSDDWYGDATAATYFGINILDESGNLILHRQVYVNASGVTATVVTETAGIISITPTSFVWYRQSTSYPFPAGYTYNWLAIA